MARRSRKSRGSPKPEAETAAQPGSIHVVPDPDILKSATRTATIADDIPIPAQRQLYLALGNAISLWQFAEMALSEVFIKIARPRTEEIGRAIFYTPRDFHSKLQTTHNAARLGLSGDLLAEWTALRTRLHNAQEIRNAMAHFGMQIEMTPEPEPYRMRGDIPVHRAVVIYRLIPNYQDPLEQFRPRDRPSLQALDAASLTDAVREFRALTDDLRAFANKIS